jgi:CBS domain containing-hemolysin-like protein
VTALVGSVLLLALNAFFVAAEFALVKVRITQLDRADARGARRALAAKAVLGRLDRYLSVTQVGVTVASLGLGWIGEPALERLADRGSVALTGAPLGGFGHGVAGAAGLAVLTFFHLLLGELVPKFVAIQRPAWVALNAALPLRVMNTALGPALWVMEKAQRAVLRLLGIDPKVASEGVLTEDEIIGILAAAAARDPRGKDKQRTIERFLRFARRPVRHMMVPRVDVVWLPVDSSGERAFEVLKTCAYSRIPLGRESIDDLVGYFYVKDFMFDEAARERTTLRGLERSVLFVPEARDGLSVLRDMQRQATLLAVVVDEYGGTSGIVTAEDLVEEFIGEIRDELDDEREVIVPVTGEPSAWDVDANAHVDDLTEVGVPMREEWQGEPIGAVIAKMLGHLPRIGDCVRLAENVLVEVIETGHRRIRRVRLRVT